MHYQVEQVGEALRFTAVAGQLPMSQYDPSMFLADTADGIPVITAQRPARMPAGHRAPGIARRMARRLARTVAALWDGLPGPWPVKVVLIAAAIIEPGPFGEMALGAYATFMAARKARRTA